MEPTRMSHGRSRIAPALVLLALAAGCGDTSANTGDGGMNDGGAGDGGATLRTLDNCGTTTSGGVPAFFTKFFRCVDLSINGDRVVIKSNDLPPHRSAYYNKTDPNWIAFDTQGGQRIQNPNRISAQAITIQIPMSPVPKGLTIDTTLVDRMAGTSMQEYRPGVAGVSLDGVAMFNGVAAPGDDIAQEEFTFDSYEAHPEMRGMYHYHAASPGPLEVLQAVGAGLTSTTPGSAEIELYAIMCDGTLVLGCTEFDGTAPDPSSFDAQNGHVGDITGKNGAVYFMGRYHTHVCRAKFPKDRYAPEIQYYKECVNQ